MKAFNYQKAIEMGYSPEEIDQFLSGTELTVINKPEQAVQPIPQVPQTTQDPVAYVQQPPDMVSPIKDESGIVTTTPFSYSHPAVDKAPLNPNQTVGMTNPIGGVPFSGTVADPSGKYYAGFGNYYGTIGASPAELAQMTPEERVRMSTTAQQIMSRNPSNEQANAELAQSFPGKNINFNAHLANPVFSDPQGVATGSAQLEMGSTGRSTGKHAHSQTIDEFGNPVDYEQMMNIVRNRQYR